ncbi:site-specific DNA-methyltransferase [Aquabacterium sp. A08]|uniref:site-specific DNA-methyltransferase n=1 Tax=Aquabacterium sp. A08 TaxID=2718532 RepID=UPI001AAEBDC5|nr:site-specific DNA-methyltransferase [Aquabacterium sp. A08]
MSIEKIEANSPEAQSANIVADNLAQLKALFPELVTEGANGAAINVDVLKALIGDQSVTDADEKYGLNWHGKKKARQIALTPSTGTLRPCPEESVDWETTQNLMIEGDNLEVLKLLQKSYAGKVKLIYIDPPYNTGNDFVYPDSFQDNIKNYLELTRQSEYGSKITTNTEASGRFHTDWLNMIYPRLRLARTLLNESGLIFISIGDAEVANLRGVCDEVFGAENFVSSIVWQKKYGPKSDAKHFSESHDFILVYARSIETATIVRLPKTEKQNDRYTNQDNDPRGPWKAGDVLRNEARDYAIYPISLPSGREVMPPPNTSWRYTKEKFAELIADNRIWFGKDGDSRPAYKRFLSEVSDSIPAETIWLHTDAGHNDAAKKELRSIFDEQAPFDTPKPIKLIERILSVGTEPGSDDVVLDFFAGSGTTAHAVFQINMKDGGKRRFILIQLPEQLDLSSKEQAASAEFCDQISRPRTISEITKERIRRAGDLIKGQAPLESPDVGFRVFKLDTSNIRAWSPNFNDLRSSLFDQLDHLEAGRSSDDILYEILLKLGLDLCVPIEVREIAGKQVNSVGAGVLMACLDESIKASEAEALALGMAAWREEQGTVGDTTAVFRDSAFENDIAKSNLAAILEQHGIKQVRSL